MQIIATLRKQTKQGLSVWSFAFNEETGVYFAVGGCDLKAIKADDKAHLRQIYMNFKGYGYQQKLTPAKPKKLAYINDPWSDLPSSFQRELEMLSA